MPIVHDQLQRAVSVPAIARRIISLVPSQTELLFDLGCGDQIAGITRYCIFPAEGCRHKPKIGGTKKFDFDKIDALQPDLILANKEENYQQGIERLEKDYPVWISDIYNLDDALHMITAVGALTGRREPAEIICNQITTVFTALDTPRHRTAAYLIWRNPWMVAGGNNFINHMMQRSGLTNVFADLTRYPQVTAKAIGAKDPELVLLSTEPFPFSNQHISEIKGLLPDAYPMLVDGTMFSWYGSRLLQAADYFRNLLLQMDSQG